MPLRFSRKREHFDLTTLTVVFPAEDGETDLLCAITAEALQDHFGAAGTSLKARLAGAPT